MFYNEFSTQERGATVKNNQLLPFERNRYYAGKMLTSADFQTEQTYMNNKRRFVNSMMFGSGIVCGCNVLSLDDLSVLVESGVAVDDFGREIVIETSVVKKLSAIDGFDALTTDKVLLCLRYKEDNVHSVFSIGHQDNKGMEYEYNRISEGYELFLKGEDEEDDIALPENELLSKQTLYSNSDFRVSLIVPSIVPKGKSVKIILRAEKLSDRNFSLSYNSILQTPVFTTENNGHEISLSLNNITLKEGAFVDNEYWVMAQNNTTEGAELVIKSGSTSVSIDGHEVEADLPASIKVSVIDTEVETLITRELSKLSLELRTGLGRKDYLVLAGINLVRTESAYIIDKITESERKKYIATPAQFLERTWLSSFFADERKGMIKNLKADSSDGALNSDDFAEKHIQVATGVLEIPLGDKPRRGDIKYSGEIMHGLGKGNVYVEIGYEQLEEDYTLGGSAKSTIYGNADLFKKAGDKNPDVETAVKVLNDKGSFVVAARIDREPEFLTLTYRWVAIKFPSGNDYGLYENTAGKSITVETPTVILGSKDSYFFNVQFNNMDRCSIAYELTEEGSGEISAEGVYTAPAKEGVYEIKIYCVENPSICTYAYAIIKKKGLENTDKT